MSIMGQMNPQQICRWHKAERLIHQWVVLQSRGTWTRWRNGLTGIFWNSSKRKSKSCPWGGTSPGMLGLPSWKAALWKRIWRCRWTPSWTWASNMPLPQERLPASWLNNPWTRPASGGVFRAGQGRESFPFAQHWWGHSWNNVFTCGLPSIRETWACWRESSEGPRRWLRDWSISHTRKGWEIWDCSAWTREGSAGSYHCVQILDVRE